MSNTPISHYLKELATATQTKEPDNNQPNMEVVFAQWMCQFMEGFDALPESVSVEQKVHIVKVLTFICCRLRQIFSVSFMTPDYYTMLTQGLNTMQHMVRDSNEAFEVRKYATGCLIELLELFTLDHTLSPMNQFRETENALGYHCGDIAAFVEHMLQQYCEGETGL